MSSDYIIDKVYQFRDNDGVETSLRLQLDHDTIVDMAVYFLNNEDEYEVNNFIKDELDEVNAISIAENLYQQWLEEAEDINEAGEECDEEEEMEEKSLEDFYDVAWEYLGESVLYYVWSDELKSDCIKYYREIK